MLLHANEIVPRERLIDELWGDSAPPTVNAALNGYLTKLRRALANGAGETALATQPPGYVLSVGAEAVDAHRFERLVANGRAALADGDAGGAAETLRKALALWRGSALADLAYEEFAQQEIRRLDELRLSALEERISADLALSRHDALVAELEALIAEHPYRERLRAQLMLALYGAGRQAEALEAYQATRQRLLDDLGIEPGPRLRELERAILDHDPSLGPPAVTRPLVPSAAGAAPRRLGRRPTILAAAAILLIAAAAAIAAVVLRDGSDPRPIAVTPHSVAVVDPETMSVVDTIPIGGTAAGIAVGEGSVWVGNADDKTLLRIDPEKRAVQARIPLGLVPTGVAVGAGTVWVLSGQTKRVTRVDVGTETVVTTIRFRGLVTDPRWFPPQIVAGGGSIWVVKGGTLSRIDPATDTATTVRDSGAPLIAYGDDALWLGTGADGDQLERLDPRTGRVVERVRVNFLGRAPGFAGLAAAAGAVWGRPFGYTTLFKFDPTTGNVLGAVPTGGTTRGIALGEDALWLVTATNALLRVDPESAQIERTLQLPLDLTLGGRFSFERAPTGTVVAGEDAVWILVQ